MKHTLKITIIILVMFLLTQYVGLVITQAYSVEKIVEQDDGTLVQVQEWTELPYEIERPDFEPSTSYVPMLIMILIATGLILLILKLNAQWLWVIWYFLSIWLCLAIALFPFLGLLWANIIGVGLSLIKTMRKSVIMHNVAEILLYGGLAAVFVPLFSIWSISILMIVLSVYDYISVYKTKHMVKMAKAQTKMKLFAGFMIPYDKGKVAILGGGDIAFPLLFTAVVLNTLSSWALIIPLCTAGALLYLFMKGEKNKFYPALPYISTACFLGLALTWIGMNII